MLFASCFLFYLVGFLRVKLLIIRFKDRVQVFEFGRKNVAGFPQNLKTIVLNVLWYLYRMILHILRRAVDNQIVTWPRACAQKFGQQWTHCLQESDQAIFALIVTKWSGESFIADCWWEAHFIQAYFWLGNSPFQEWAAQHCEDVFGHSEDIVACRHVSF